MHYVGHWSRTKEYNKDLITLWFIDPARDIIGRFLSWLGSRIFTFGKDQSTLPDGERSIYQNVVKRKYT